VKYELSFELGGECRLVTSIAVPTVHLPSTLPTANRDDNDHFRMAWLSYISVRESINEETFGKCLIFLIQFKAQTSGFFALELTILCFIYNGCFIATRRARQIKQAVTDNLATAGFVIKLSVARIAEKGPTKRHFLTVGLISCGIGATLCWIKVTHGAEFGFASDTDFLFATITLYAH
jgi:hypothetical protein